MSTDWGTWRPFEFAARLWRALRRKDARGATTPGAPAPGARCIFALDEEGNPRPEGPILRVSARRPPVEDLEALEDRMDVEEARRLLADPDEKPIPYEQVRQELGLE